MTCNACIHRHGCCCCGTNRRHQSEPVLRALVGSRAEVGTIGARSATLERSVARCSIAKEICLG